MDQRWVPRLVSILRIRGRLEGSKVGVQTSIYVKD